MKALVKRISPRFAILTLGYAAALMLLTLVMGVAMGAAIGPAIIFVGAVGVVTGGIFFRKHLR